jgi:hypothetical protein
MVGLIGAGISAMGSVMSGMAQQQVANYNAEVARANAEAAVREGFAQSGATRDQFSEVKGAQAAALAKSGVDVNAGTSAVLGLETQRREETAAAVDIWRGRTEQTKYKNQAETYKAEGKAAMMIGVIGAASSLVGGLSGMGQGAPLQLGQAAPQVIGAPTAVYSPKPLIPVTPMRMNRGML